MTRTSRWKCVAVCAVLFSACAHQVPVEAHKPKVDSTSEGYASVLISRFALPPRTTAANQPRGVTLSVPAEEGGSQSVRWWYSKTGSGDALAWFRAHLPISAFVQSTQTASAAQPPGSTTEYLTIGFPPANDYPFREAIIAITPAPGGTTIGIATSVLYEKRPSTESIPPSWTFGHFDLIVPGAPKKTIDGSLSPGQVTMIASTFNALPLSPGSSGGGAPIELKAQIVLRAAASASDTITILEQADSSSAVVQRGSTYLPTLYDPNHSLLRQTAQAAGVDVTGVLR